MIILRIYDGHNCGAKVMIDGVIIASVSEERLFTKKMLLNTKKIN
jgi:predicted NodU family carbamoyl transferase